MIWVLFFTIYYNGVDTKIIKMPSKEECQRVGNLLNDRYNKRSGYATSETFCIEMKRDTRTI